MSKNESRKKVLARFGNFSLSGQISKYIIYVITFTIIFCRNFRCGLLLNVDYIKFHVKCIAYNICFCMYCRHKKSAHIIFRFFSFFCCHLRFYFNIRKTRKYFPIKNCRNNIFIIKILREHKN